MLKGKYEKGEDSDGDSVYRKVQKSDSYTKAVKGAKTLSSSGAVDPDDLQKLQDELFKFTDDAGLVPKKTVKGVAAKTVAIKGKGNDEAKTQSEALKNMTGKGKGGKIDLGILALADISPPVDPNSVAPQVEAKSRCKKAGDKLVTKVVELDAIITGIGKTTDQVAVSVKQQCKELKTKIKAQCKFLTKCAMMHTNKVVLEELKMRASPPPRSSRT